MSTTKNNHDNDTGDDDQATSENSMKQSSAITTTPNNEDTFVIVAGDVGGTNSRLALYTSNGERLYHRDYRNEEYLLKDDDDDVDTTPSDRMFEQKILIPFLQCCCSEGRSSTYDWNVFEIVVVCLAVAGPVKDNTVQTSRHKALEINGYDLLQRCQNSGDPFIRKVVQCYIINDFVAQGYGCLTLQKDDVVEIDVVSGSNNQNNQQTKNNPNNNNKKKNGPIVCIGAGTGFGTCYLTTTTGPAALSSDKNSTATTTTTTTTTTRTSSSYYTCLPSEFGQIEWTPRTEQEIDLWRYLKQKLDSPNRVSLEEVVSGTGLAYCYDGYAALYPQKVTPSIHEQCNTAGDMKGKVVADHADDCEVCHMAMTTVMRSYGAAASTCAMTFLPTGGLYISGGLAPKHLSSWIQGSDSCFLTAYRDKGRASSILNDIPLFVVTCDDLGLRGAYQYALQQISIKQQQNDTFQENESMDKDGRVQGRTVVGWEECVET
ncbi:glucokinase [Nitzschia inconspicua]|uniref:Glucokinase n=1 Tax=Nitzschia inconspicua TaxID=303405 RepID=A0A9K3PEG8_9STRA|nr:glucokinase [Nitzschia inconspicua]